jgi:hypothetical protein
MVALTWVVAGVVGVLLLSLLGVYALRARMTSGNDDVEEAREEHARDDADRDAAGRASSGSDRSSVPIHRRVASKTLPSKLLMVGVVTIVLVVGWQVYGFFKAGSPTQLIVAREFQIALAAALAIPVAIGYERKRAAHEAELHLIYEPAPDNDLDDPHAETVYFDERDTRGTEDGELIYEYQRQRFFGLFRNPKLAADDRRLQSSGSYHRPPDAKVAHLIPPQATEVRDGVYVARTKGRRVSQSPETVEDYRYRTPYSVSWEDEQRMKTNMEMWESQIEQERTKNAQLHEQIRALRDRNENMATEDWTRLFTVVEQMMPLFRRHGYATVARSARDGLSAPDDEDDLLGQAENIANGTAGSTNGRAD